MRLSIHLRAFALAILPLFQIFIAEGVKEGLQGFRANINTAVNCWNMREWYWTA